MRKILLMVLTMVIIVVGCGKIDEKPVTKTTEKKEELVMTDEVETEENAENNGEKNVTEETMEETPTESALEEPVQKEETKKTTQTTEAKTATETEAPTVTTPTIADPVATTPEPGAQECQHTYEPVETEEYDMISHYVFASNCCGYPLFEIVNNDAVNIPDLYVHPDYHDEESGIECTKKFTSWHSEYFYSGFCYECCSKILLRTCTVFYVRAEQCVKNEGTLGEYEKVEPGHAYIESCDCGQNILMSGPSGKGLILKKEVCSFCGDTKAFPER